MSKMPNFRVQPSLLQLMATAVDVPRTLVMLATWACLAAIASLAMGCERQSVDPSPHGESDAASKDLIWSFITDDSLRDPRIHKWIKPELRGLMIIDHARADFYREFAPLAHQVGDEGGIRINICEAIVTLDESVLPSPGCDGTSFDFYFVITDGNWTELEKDRVGKVLSADAAYLFSDLRNDIATTQRGKENICRYVRKFNDKLAGELVGGLAIVDSKEPRFLGKCSSYLFLNMLGLYPFDGTQPLDPDKEAGNIAEFLLKRTPYGAEYLLRLLYAPAVKPGMHKPEFIQTLAN
jgi:hypothetical protein